VNGIGESENGIDGKSGCGSHSVKRERLQELSEFGEIVCMGFNELPIDPAVLNQYSGDSVEECLVRFRATIADVQSRLLRFRSFADRSQ